MSTPMTLDLQQNAGPDTAQFLTFLLDGEEYGVDILRVQELKAWDAVTPLPNTPDWVLGVINLRGVIVPIVDLRRRFGLPEIAYGKTTVVVVLKVEAADRTRIMGVVVDAVSDVYNVAPADRKPTPDVGGAATAFVQGLATVSDKMVILLDIDGLLGATAAHAALASH
jgi:purine-binding chemotaxis protein CheW